MDQFYKTYGWRSMRWGDYSDDYHTFVLEWSPDFMWTYVDKRTSRILDMRFNKKSFFERGDFPPTILNNTNVPVVLTNPWAGGTRAAPFDKPFYLALTLGAGGTDGWFQDNEGGKMWYDGSSSAMLDFANNKDKWHSTWSKDNSRRAFAIDYVKMWSKC
ncbi:SubName: Full=Related to beta-1,3-glucan binding protein {ECO:0000313/EMBL:CCA68527.1} [Serendipita indica DSM 11827]|nr:SubName: Full=Related to beta-1,3-glucan binding protein {ECO:0000313/EMBL:CCA68527.1} [Serendipita indica DSM 11827]